MGTICDLSYWTSPASQTEIPVPIPEPKYYPQRLVPKNKRISCPGIDVKNYHKHLPIWIIHTKKSLRSIGKPSALLRYDEQSELFSINDKPY